MPVCLAIVPLYKMLLLYLNLQIKVSQIPGHTKWTASPDCLQYHTGQSGTFRGFNHPAGTIIQAQLYQICIRQEEGSCSIAYRQILTSGKVNLTAKKLEIFFAFPL